MQLPSHARTEEETFPDWKVQFIRKNRNLYERNKKWIDRWLPRFSRFLPACKSSSGITRAENATFGNTSFSFELQAFELRSQAVHLACCYDNNAGSHHSLAAKIHDASRVRKSSITRELRHLPTASTKAFKALGNAVNADIVELIGKSLLGFGQRKLDPKNPQTLLRIQRKRSRIVY